MHFARTLIRDKFIMKFKTWIYDYYLIIIVIFHKHHEFSFNTLVPIMMYLSKKYILNSMLLVKKCLMFYLISRKVFIMPETNAQEKLPMLYMCR